MHITDDNVSQISSKKLLGKHLETIGSMQEELEETYSLGKMKDYFDENVTWDGLTPKQRFALKHNSILAKVKPIPMPIKREEVWRLGYDNLKDNWAYFAGYCFMWMTGCRLSELLTFNKGNGFFDSLHGHKVYVAQLITLKSKKQAFREIPIIVEGRDKKFFNVFNKYMENYTDGARLFPKTRSDWYHTLAKKIHHNVQAYTLQPRAIFGIEHKLNPHYLRHCRLSCLAGEGFSASQIQAFAGHSNIKSAEPYVKIAWNYLGDTMIANDKREQLLQSYDSNLLNPEHESPRTLYEKKVVASDVQVEIPPI